jgi:hypothetical protein
MQVDMNTVLLFLLGALQMWFWQDKARDATERKEMKDSIKAMEQILAKMQAELAVSKFALFNKEHQAGNSKNEQ